MSLANSGFKMEGLPRFRLLGDGANRRVKYVLDKLGILGTDITFQRHHGEDLRLRSRSLTSYNLRSSTSSKDKVADNDA